MQFYHSTHMDRINRAHLSEVLFGSIQFYMWLPRPLGGRGVVRRILGFTCKCFYMKKSVFLTLLSIIILSSCEKQVTIEIPEKEPRLTVSGFVGKGEPFGVTVGKSRHILAGDASSNWQESYIVKNAVPVIYENGVAIDTLVYQSSRQYLTVHNKIVRMGYTYTIKVMAPGFKEIEATTIVPTQSEIAGTTIHRRARVNSYGEDMDDIIVKLNDPAGEKNFYLIQVLRAGYQNAGYGIGCISTADKDIETMGGESDPMETESCYDASNLLMKDDNFNGRQKQLKLSAYSGALEPWTDHTNGKVYRPFIRVYRVTEEYFKYAKSLGIYANGDDNPFAEPVNVFSNVKNGYGMFSTYTVAVDTLR
jgi:hypothetical protein